MAVIHCFEKYHPYLVSPSYKANCFPEKELVKLNRRWCYDWYSDTLRHAFIVDIQVFNSFTILNFSFPLIICANMIKTACSVIQAAATASAVTE